MVPLHIDPFCPASGRFQGRLVDGSFVGLCVFSIKSYNAHVRVTQKDAGRELVLFAWTWFTWAAKPSVNHSRHPA
jgi:hypothetical protein